ncbi:MAG: mechanosensitive ion channel [Desulfovibrionaceae bacterium]|nr:mechanosensitive ion channel [Desulfovibrionaceae bacterium]
MEWLIQLWNSYSAVILKIGIRIALIFVVIIMATVIQKIVKHALHKAHISHKLIDPTLLPVLTTITNYCIYGVAIVIILDLFGVNTTSIVAIIGAAGIAIGISLKDTLGNIASGIMLLFLRPFRINDYVECASISGTVEKIDLFTTNFKTVEGIFITVPNSVIFSSPIVNYTYHPIRRMSLSVGISYTDSIETGMAVLYSIAKEDARILQTEENAPYVLMKEMGDSSITLELRLWTTTDVYWDVYWDTNKKIKESIEKAGLSIPFPIRTLYIENNK